MKLISLKLCNFRQFYGKTPEIMFAGGQVNTTVIHGNNGSGKTTLLNAFTWILYEKFTAAFASPEQLVNKRALLEAKSGQAVECWGEIAFEHDFKRYQLKRLVRVYPGETVEAGKSQLLMQVAGDDGRWQLPREHPEDIIGRILPESLHRYFFFDGERIEHIVRSEQKTEIAEATKELLGVKVLERAIEHLKKAKRSLEDELRTIGNLQIKQLLKQQQEFIAKQEQIEQRQQEIQQELLKQTESKKGLSQQLLELSGAAQLQQLKFNLESQMQSLRINLLQARTNIKKTISTRGYLVFLEDLNQQYYTIVKQLRDRGELPIGINKQFIEDLLTRQTCICGTELTENSNAKNQVASWLQRAGLADVEESLIRLETQITELEKYREQFWQEADKQQAQIHQWRIELSQIETELDNLKDKLRNYPDADIQKSQKELDKIESLILNLTLEQGVKQQELSILNNNILAKEQEIKKQKLKGDKQTLIQKQIKATQDSIERLTEVRSRLEKQFRLQLETKVQEIFQTISFTPYLPQLSDKYELNLIENTIGIPSNVAASTGENQILSLSFIGGIIDRVREWSHKNTLMGPDSSNFPIAMDSPFGTLDEIYRRQVARCLPQLANQLIVLVTKTQWRGEVEQEMNPYLGKEYILVYHSPKPDCEADMIELNGVSYPLVKLSANAFEYTEIIEVK